MKQQLLLVLMVIFQVVPAFGQETDSLLLLTQEQADSLEFRLKHHYTNNFNFRVKADSIQLVPRDDEMTDTCVVFMNDIIAVAKIKTVNDTVWVKVARDQITMGWVTEEQLLGSSTPDDGISVIIDRLTGTRAIWMSSLLALGILALFFIRHKTRVRHIHSRLLEITGRKSEKTQYIANGKKWSGVFEYPLLLLITCAVATIYTGVQTHAPEFWQEYYFHPTLNPLILPGIMSVLLTLVWLQVISFIAIVIDVYNNYYFIPGAKLILEVLGAAMLTYLIVSLSSTLISWIFALFIAIAIFITILFIYFRYIHHRYQCPVCGARLHDKGICPECGTKLI